MQALSIAGLSVLQLYLLAAALRRRQHGHDASNFTQVSLWGWCCSLRLSSGKHLLLHQLRPGSFRAHNVSNDEPKQQQIQETILTLLSLISQAYHRSASSACSMLT